MNQTSIADGKRLLLIDDDANLLLLVKDYLELKGFEVITAENGKEGIAVLQKEIPDLIICDVIMPEMNGYSFVQQVKKDSRISKIPVLFLSAKGQNKDRVEGLQMGADAYMVKPFEPEELIVQVKALLNSQFQPCQAANQAYLEGRTEPLEQLTPVERRLLESVSSGVADREIVPVLNISSRSVENQGAKVLSKTLASYH